MPGIRIDFSARSHIPSVLQPFQTIVVQNAFFEEQVQEHGLLIISPDENELEIFEQRLHEADYTSIRRTAGRLRLQVDAGSIDSLLSALHRILAQSDEPREILLRRGLVLELKEINDEAVGLLRQSLNAEGATVTIIEDPSDAAIYFVRGTVREMVTDEPLAGVSIDARFFSASKRQLTLATTVSDADGAYEVPFKSDELAAAAAGERVDVAFTVTDGDERLEYPPGRPPRLNGLSESNQGYDIRVVHPRIFTLSGRVADAATGRAVPGLAIDFSFTNPRAGRLLQTATTSDPEGRYQTTFSSTIFAGLDETQRVDVSVQWFIGDERSSTRVVLRDLPPADAEADITFEPDELSQPPALRPGVRGRVTSASGRPLGGLQVAAFARGVGWEDWQESTETDGAGRYTLPATVHDDCSALVLRVLDDDGGTLKSAEPIFELRPDHVVDFVIDGEPVAGPSEYQRHQQAIGRCLRDRHLGDLDDQDLVILAGTSGVPSDRLQLMRLDARWCRVTRFPVSSFYALLRQDLPRDLRRLMESKRAAWRTALTSSLDQGIVDSAFRERIDELLDDFEELATTMAFEPDDAVPTPPLGVLTRTAADVDEDLQTQFVRYQLRYEGNEGDEAFWASLREQPAFAENPGVVEALRFTVDSNALLGGNLAALNLVQERRIERGWRSVRDLARLNRREWRDIVEQTGPAPGVDDPDAYAEGVAHAIERLFPTAVIAYQLASDEHVGSSDLTTFFAANPDYDIILMPVDDYLGNGANLSGIADRAALGSQLKTFRRLSLMVDRNIASIIQTLMANDWGSATVISGDRSGFMETMTPVVGGGVASEFYEKARVRIEEAQMILPWALDYTDGFLPGVFPSLDLPDDGRPDWMRLFGAQSGCACEHCSSVYSPAAYMVDLLQFLREAPVKSDQRPLDLFLRRRPDIEHILLECKNTNTRLPYIDLVNEVLEDAVSRLAPDGTSRPFEAPDVPPGDAPESELAEYRQSVARFQTTWEEARLRAEPEHERTEVYEALAGAAYPWNAAIAPEMERAWFFLDYLGLGLHSLWETFDQPVPYQVMAFFRISLPQWLVLARSLATSDLTPEERVERLAEFWGIVPAPEIEDSLVLRLSHVSLFLDRSGLSYEELQELADARFLFNEVIEADSPRPVRRPRLAIAPVPGGDPCDIAHLRIAGLDFETLDVLHRFLRLQRKSGWSLKFFADVLATFNYYWDRSDFVAVSARLAMYITRLASRLGVSVEYVVALYRLSADQRRDTWARTFEMAGEEYDRFVQLCRDNPYSSPESCRLMLDKRDVMGWTSLKSAELLYVLQGQDGPPSLYTPAPEDVERFLLGLRDLINNAVEEQLGGAAREIEQAVAEFRRTNDDETEVRRFRTSYVDNLRRDFAERAILQTVAASVAQFVSVDPLVADALLHPQRDDTGTVIGEAVLDAVDAASVPAIADFENLIGLPVDDSSPVTASEEYARAAVLLARLDKVARLVRGLRLSASQLRVMHALREANGFLNLNDLPLTPEPPSARLRARADAFFEMASAKRFHGALSTQGPDLFDLMAEAPEDAARGDSEPIFFAFLEQQVGWLQHDLAILKSLNRQLDRFRTWRTYQQILDAHRLARRGGVTIRNLANWSVYGWVRNADAVQRYARDIQAAARSKHLSEEAWYRTLTSFQDVLRETKRDALLAYLIHAAPEFKDVVAVYGHRLIDPEMSSCQLTSRIKQANASIQLFVQRCLMGLEPDAPPDPDDPDPERPFWGRWDWMKNYRVWEANRKVFLYPENWLEPDLRDDQSPFFLEAANNLLEDELTTAAAERTFLNYLEAVEDVSRLDIRALYEDDARATLHVFARTRATPYRYYHRSRLQDDRWTAWEPMEIDIEGDHLCPVIHNSRLFLFWAAFSESETELGLNFFWSEHAHGRWAPRRSARRNPLFTISLKNNADSDKRPLYKFKPAHFFIRSLVASGSRLGFILFSGVRTHDDEDGHHTMNSYKGFSLALFEFDHCRQDLVRVLDGLDLKHSYGEPGYNFVAMHLVSKLQQHFAAPLKIHQQVGPSEFLDLEDPAALDKEIMFIDDFKNIARATSPNLEVSRPTALLQTFSTPRTILPAYQEQHFTGSRPFVVENSTQTFLVNRKSQLYDFSGIWAWGPTEVHRFHFQLFYHPFVCEMVEMARSAGVHGFLAPGTFTLLDRQLAEENGSLDSLGFTAASVRPDSINVEFGFSDVSSIYNWEIFFHLALLTAARLSNEIKFQEADRWLRYIFDPADLSSHAAPQKYWRVKPFFEKAARPPETLIELLRRIARGEEREQIRVWRDDPFNPHAIARLRIVAYMRSTVMRYLDNLIAWGDQLFQLDTIETNNEATQLYMRVFELLGPGPVQLPAVEPNPLTYAFVAQRDGEGRAIGPFSNIWLELEDWLPADLDAAVFSRATSGAVPILHPYFCIPANPKLQEYRDTIAGRLFKIRHCMNIEGQVRELPLFEPPIDPALLVRARAAGLDLRTVLSDVASVRQPHYRYTYLHQKALEFAGEVRAFESAWLAALEKKDAEALAVMRSTHEFDLLSSARAIKQQQVREAQETLASLQEARKLAEQRKTYYESRPFMNAGEVAQQDLTIQSTFVQTAASALELAAANSHGSPDYYAGGLVGGLGGGTIFLTKAGGGSSTGAALSAMSGELRIFSNLLQTSGSLAGTMAGYQRRQDDWRFQAGQAETELDQIDKQTLAAEIRLAIAEKDLTNHERQIEQAREVGDFLREKFTDAELYGWMTGQLSALHHQAFRLAFDLARGAERAAQLELGVEPDQLSFVRLQVEHAKGRDLLAGARLVHQLRQMEASYLEQNRRELEITKHASLAMLDPAELVRLRETGSCRISIPEVLFDLDFPGHYRRRIKAVSLTIPCVVGPYTSVSATLRLVSSRWRTKVPQTGDEGDAWATEFGGTDSIAVSTAQNDSGLFELNFRDERFLPFEGAGAVCEWMLDLPPRSLAPFDYGSISDVIIRLAYTARDGGDTYRGQVSEAIEASIRTWLQDIDGPPLRRLFSLRHDFPSAWHSLLHPSTDPPTNATEITLGEQHFFFFMRRILLRPGLRVVPEVLLKPKEGFDPAALSGVAVRFGLGEPAAGAERPAEGDEWGGLPWVRFPEVASTPLTTWRLSLASAEESPPSEDIFENIGDRWIVKPDVLDDVLIAFAVVNLSS